MILAVVSSMVLGFIAGVLVHRKHSAKADTIEAKSKALLAALKGK